MGVRVWRRVVDYFGVRGEESGVMLEMVVGD